MKGMIANNNPAKLTRRDFLNLTVVGAGAGLVAARQPAGGLAAPEELQVAPESIHPVEVDRLVMWEYHDPWYEDSYLFMTPEIFESQIRYLRERNYHTLTQDELLNFIDGLYSPPYPSCVVRVDAGMDKVVTLPDGTRLNAWKALIDYQRRFNIHAIWYVMSGSFPNTDALACTWQDVADWCNEGLISVGSHGVTHPRYDQISTEEAVRDVRQSKAFLENVLAEHGARVTIQGFAFPYDITPAETSFFQGTGYRYAVAGATRGQLARLENVVLKNDNNRYMLPSLYPYIRKSWREWYRGTGRSNPAQYYPIVSGTENRVTFGEILGAHEQIIPAASIPSASLYTYGNREQTLPFPDVYMRPDMIVLHTAGQSGDLPGRWTTGSVYNGLISSGMTVQFAVGLNGVNQYCDSYRDAYNQVWFPVNERGGAQGANERAISIEMSGRWYDNYFDPETPTEFREAVQTIFSQTLNLVKTLCTTLNIPIERVVGHNEISVDGKSDPGKKFSPWFRSMLQNKFLRKPIILKE